jgi:predicted transcriptional regulator
MAEYKFGLTGQDRKALVGAISEILGQPKKYLGTPSYAFQVGDITINKEGTATGEFPFGLLTALAERGFVSIIGTSDEEDAPEMETPEEAAEAEAEAEALAENAPEAAEFTETATVDRLTIEYPLDGFSPEKLDNLQKMIDSKAVLIKKMVGAEELPIAITESTIKFAWFSADIDGETVNAYAQFIAALCETAKAKTRVVAQPHEAFENEKFAMRVFGIGLGLKGEEYALCRKLMMQNLTGDSGHRYGKPEDGAPSRRRDSVQREVVSIRLTPDTLEKLSILAANFTSETGQRASRNMLIEQAVEAYVAAEYANAAHAPEAEAPTATEAVNEAALAPQAAEYAPVNKGVA